MTRDITNPSLPRDLPSIEVLREHVTYDPETGSLTWLSRDDPHGGWNTKYAGKPAFNIATSAGYRRGCLFGKMILGHRVAYAFIVGHTDFEFIDHINGDRSDNRAKNLRAVSHIENCRNKARPSNGKSGHIGVSARPNGSWKAHIMVNNRQITLGIFPSIGDAIAARAGAEAQYGFHPNHGRSLT